jgi:hypothetical protein
MTSRPQLRLDNMAELNFDVLLGVAAFCAGSFEFRTLLNMALTCKSIHQAVKPILDTPILVCSDYTDRDGGFPIPDEFLEQHGYGARSYDLWVNLNRDVWSRIK